MGAHRRAPRPYRGGKRSLHSRSSASHTPDRRPSTLTADLAFDPNQPRDGKGQWTDISDLSPTGHGNDWPDVTARLKGTKPVADYRAAIRRGDSLDPVRLGGLRTKYVRDGHHRVVASLLEGLTKIRTIGGPERGATLSLASGHPDIIGDIDLAFDPNQPRDDRGRWVADPANIVAKWAEATPGERSAGADWYPAAHRTAVALSKRFNVSVPEAAGLLAAYSPQTPWGRNQVEASESLRYGHGVGGPHAAVWFTHDDPRVEDRVGIMATRNTRALADAVIGGEDFDTASAGRNKNGTVKPKALKIRSFYHLIAAGGQDDPSDPHVVIDRHAMSVAYGRRVTEEDYTRLRPASRKQYEPFVEAYEKAAQEISRMEGHPVAPETVQATTWLVQQRENAARSTRVGKTRKALGKRDWNEWLKYAQRYLGLDADQAAQVGYTNLARMVMSRDIDLAYDPNQPRDSKGRWTDASGVLPSSKRFGPKHLKTIFEDDAPATGEPFTVLDENGKPVVEEEPYYDPPADKGRPDMFGAGTWPGPGPGEEESMRTQRRAQQKAQKWYQSDGSAVGTPYEDPAAVVWSVYQQPDQYGVINGLLRGLQTKATVTEHGGWFSDDHTFDFTQDSVKAAAKKMFDEAGTTTTKPMTTYRALRNTETIDWAQRLTPGSTFREDGIVSSTVYRRLAEGWLGLSGTRNADVEDMSAFDSDDVVLEIKVPAGSRIVGGVTQFIETMLPPGTKFKIVSSKKVRTRDAVNPLGNVPVDGEVTYTHVVAEAILPPDYIPKKAKRHRAKKGSGPFPGIPGHYSEISDVPAIKKSPYAVDEGD